MEVDDRFRLSIGIATGPNIVGITVVVIVGILAVIIVADFIAVDSH